MKKEETAGQERRSTIEQGQLTCIADHVLNYRLQSRRIQCIVRADATETRWSVVT